MGTFGKLDFAHNTYLEVLQGLGLLFGSMPLASVSVMVWRYVKLGCDAACWSKQVSQTYGAAISILHWINASVKTSRFMLLR